jgi:predicted dehydrogenase
MLDKETDIDAVTISTPDHTHAVITMEAMKKGKHVFTQKPLTRTVDEYRKIVEYAKKNGIATQMGNQVFYGCILAIVVCFISNSPSVFIIFLLLH